MILEEKIKDLVVVGEDTSKKARISSDKLAKLQYLLTKGLYKDPITAVIAEWTNNGIDAVVQAGKNPVENPVLVTIGITPDSKGQTMFRVEDKGTGLDDRDFEDICMNYLESTKESDNDTIGHFGIGMKSFLSLERSATFTCRKNGWERKYIVYEGSEFVNFDLIYCKETTEENGVVAELKISNWDEKNLFVTKARAKLAYYDTAVLITDNHPVDNEIYRNELFQWSSMSYNQNMHLSLKDVYYQIDWEALGIKQINIPIAIRLSLKDGLIPTPSRESYITNDKTKDLILGKIKQIAEWFVNKYNGTVKECKSFMEAFEYLGVTEFYVKLNRDFHINSLLQYSKTKICPVKVDGITLREPNYYKNRSANFLRGYTPIGYTNYMGVTNTKRITVSREGHIFRNKGVTVLVGEDFKGNLKEYLKDKHGKSVMFLKRNDFMRKLSGGKHPKGSFQKIDVETYSYVLDLHMKPKTEWRANVAEWDFVVSSIVATFKDETKAAATQEFVDWLEKKKEDQKEKRKLKGIPEYQGLGKQLGDVTMAYAYKRYSKVHFAKKAYPIADLAKNKFLTVLVTDDDDIELVKGIADSLKTDKVHFALVGKKEVRKIPDHFQFINFQKFMSRDCRPFMRLASAIKFKEALDEFDHIKNYKSVVFKHLFKSFNDDAERLRKYVSEHTHYGLGEKLDNIIIDVADQHNLYDMTLWAEYKRLKHNVEKYDFINLIHVPSTTNHDLTKRYERLITQILLFRKKYYDDLPEGARIVFDDPKDIKTQI